MPKQKSNLDLENMDTKGKRNRKSRREIKYNYEDLGEVYRLNLGQSHYYFSKKCYGEYAEKICKQCLEYESYCGNYYEIIDENYSYLVTFSFSYGIIKSKIDTKNIEKLRVCNWRANLMQGSELTTELKFYMENNTYGKLHRYLLKDQVPDDKVIDHFDRNSLNNTEENFRIVTQRENILNSNLKYNIKSGHRGIVDYGTRFAVELVFKGNRIRKSFSKSKCKDALTEAIKYRNEILIQNGINPENYS